MARKWAVSGLATLLFLAAFASRSAGQEGPRTSLTQAAAIGGDREAGRVAYRVAAIGDSLTDARSHGGKYLDYLRAACPESRFDNYGKGGENVEQMRRRFARDVLGASRPAYTHVIVFGGVNDILGDMSAGRSPAKIQRDLEAMYDTARQAGMRTVAITVAPWGGLTGYYTPRRALATRNVNQWILSQAREGHIDHAVDAHSLLSCGDPEKLCNAFQMRWIRDGLHFNEEAHVKLGKVLLETVFSRCR